MQEKISREKIPEGQRPQTLNQNVTPYKMVRNCVM